MIPQFWRFDDFREADHVQALIKNCPRRQPPILREGPRSQGPFQPALEHSTSCRDIVDYSTVCLSVKLVTLNQIIDILMPSEY